MTWLDGSDEVQDGQEEAAGEIGEWCEVWKERVERARDARRSSERGKEKA